MAPELPLQQTSSPTPYSGQVLPRNCWAEAQIIQELDSRPVSLTGWEGISYLRLQGPSPENMCDNRAYLIQIGTKASMICIPVGSKEPTIAQGHSSSKCTPRNYFPEPIKQVQKLEERFNTSQKKLPQDYFTCLQC